MGRGRQCRGVAAGGVALALLLAGTSGTGPSWAESDAAPRGVVLDDAALSQRAAPTAAHTPSLIRRTGDLTTRPAGMPTTDAPARRLVSASVTQDLQRGRVSVSARLAAMADSSTESNLWVGFGRLDGTHCPVDLVGYVNTRPGSGHLADYGADGSISFEEISPEARSAHWDCAAVFLVHPGDAKTQYDALGGVLTDVHAEPAPELDITAVAQASLQRARWKALSVTVKNPGTGPARSTRLRVSGPGVAIKPKAVPLGTIEAGASKRTKIRVRVNGRADRRITLRASSEGASATHRIDLRPVFKGRTPVPGTYKGANGVSFTITKRRTITKWRASVRQQCGYGMDATWMTSTLTFPTAKISRSGKVARTYQRSDYTKKLTALVDGRQVLQGTFTYHFTPARCSGALSWTARRTGK